MYQIKAQMSTVGDGLACGKKPKIQVEFPQRTAKGVRECLTLGFYKT